MTSVVEKGIPGSAAGTLGDDRSPTTGQRAEPASGEQAAKLNICFVSSEYPSDHHRGGIGTYTEKTARALAALGHNVAVITEALDVPSTGTENGVLVVRVCAPTGGRLRLVNFARTVARAIRQLPWQPDVVQVCEHRAEGVWLALRKLRGTRLVTRLATPTFLVQELNADVAYSRRQTRYMDTLERIQCRRSDAIISPTHALADVVCRRWRIDPKRVSILRTGVDFRERFADSAAELPEVLRGRDYLLYFGRLEERKGVHILARALPDVLAAHPDLHVVLAGDNLLSYRGRPMQAFIEECLHEYLDRVHFLPRLPQRELYPVLGSALAVVLPSMWEALGNVTLETVDMGRAVIATTGSGFGEVIEDGRSGILVPPGDVPALREAMLRLVGDPALRARLSAAATERAHSFNLTSTARDLVDFYGGLVRTSPSRRLPGANRSDDRPVEVAAR